MKLYIVACAYDVTPQFISLWIGKKISYDNYQLIIVNNNPLNDISCASQNTVVLTGSNELYEFSAYQEGMSYIKTKGDYKDSLILVLNDTLFTKHNAEFFISSLMKNKQTIQRLYIPAMAGRFDTYNNICYENPWGEINGYISSFCMLMNSAAIDIFIDSIAKIKDPYPFKVSAKDATHWSTDIDVRFREFVISHLVDTQTATVWYQAKKNEIAAGRINIKAKCVFLEHFSSGRIAKQGVLISIFPTWKLKTQNFIYEQLAKIKRKVSNLR